MKNIILTWWSGWIWSAIAKDLHQRWYEVYNIDILKPKNDWMFKDSFSIDLSMSSSDIEGQIWEIVNRINSIHWLVHSAWYGWPYQKITDVTWEEWKKVFNINMESFFTLSKYVLPVMERQRFWRIVAIASSLSIVWWAQSVAYSSAKHALVWFTKSIADEWGEYGITANCISPWYVKSNMWPSSDKHTLEIISKTPSKRIAESSEIARLVSFILDSESGYINGVNYAIDWWLTAI